MLLDVAPMSGQTNYSLSVDSLDRGPGSGSLDTSEAFASEMAQERRMSNDGRSETRTTFYFDDPADPRNNRTEHQKHRDPTDRRSWQTLAQWNDGVGTVRRDRNNFDADVRRWVETFGSATNCTEQEIFRATFVAEHVDMETFGQIPAEHIIAGILSLVVDSERDHDIDEFEFDDWYVRSDEFQGLMDDLDLEYDRLWLVRDRLGDQVDI